MIAGRKKTTQQQQKGREACLTVNAFACREEEAEEIHLPHAIEGKEQRNQRSFIKCAIY